MELLRWKFLYFIQSVWAFGLFKISEFAYSDVIQNCVCYHFNRSCILTSCHGDEGISNAQANFVLPEMNKLSEEIKSGSLAILFISSGMPFCVFLNQIQVILIFCFAIFSTYAIFFQWSQPESAWICPYFHVSGLLFSSVYSFDSVKLPSHVKDSVCGSVKLE